MCHPQAGGAASRVTSTKMTALLSVCRYAAAVQDGSQYFVLLIITDGVISDMAQTKEAIVNVSAAAACRPLRGRRGAAGVSPQVLFVGRLHFFLRLSLTLAKIFLSLWHWVLRILRDGFCSTCPSFLQYFFIL